MEQAELEEYIKSKIKFQHHGGNFMAGSYNQMSANFICADGFSISVVDYTSGRKNELKKELTKRLVERVLNQKEHPIIT